MVINYLGDGCFRLQSGELSVLVNPANHRLKADVVLRTLTLANVAPPPDEIIFPGEYEVKGIEIQGYPLAAESTDKFIKTVYLVRWEEMQFLFLGHISKPLPAELIEEFEPDVLFLPTGDDHFLAPADAAKLVRQLEPAVTMPGYYKEYNSFAKAFGQKAEVEEKFVFRKKDLDPEKSRLLVLEAKDNNSK